MDAVASCLTRQENARLRAVREKEQQEWARVEAERARVEAQRQLEEQQRKKEELEALKAKQQQME